jgi:hypothetical protein
VSDLLPTITTRWILDQRGPKNSVDPAIPNGYFVEEEVSSQGDLEAVATILLTNRECPLRCTMCDLWKNTTDNSVRPGAIPGQIDHALSSLAPTAVVKLYNSGNFFDRQAIPRADWEEIADRVRSFRQVIVETHPRMLDGVEEFQSLIAPAQLQVAMGLESIHPQVLPRLNKQMTLDDFSSACARLLGVGITVRCFILLRPPWLNEKEGCQWALKSLDFAFSAGVECCSLVPTRVGNGAMEALEAAGQFSPPCLRSMETVLSSGLRDGRGRVLMDLWDVERFFRCPDCDQRRVERVRQMNRHQRSLPPTKCEAC